MILAASFPDNIRRLDGTVVFTEGPVGRLLNDEDKAKLIDQLKSLSILVQPSAAQNLLLVNTKKIATRLLV